MSENELRQLNLNKQPDLYMIKPVKDVKKLKLVTWEEVEKIAKSKGYELEHKRIGVVNYFRVRRLNWFSNFYIAPEGLKAFLEEKAIDYGKGYIP